MREYTQINSELIEFIKHSPSAFHAVLQAEKMLLENGFVQLFANKPWHIENGGKYYTKTNNSAIIAFIMPKNNYIGAHIVATHSDSPTFKIKANPEIVTQNAYITLNIEKYGGMLLKPWCDRPLSIAGRVIISQNGNLVEKFIHLKRDVLMIANLAIHMDRDSNTQRQISVQKEFMPLFALSGGIANLNDILAKELQIEKNEIIDSDLFLYCTDEGKIWGANNEFLSAPRLDDLQCTFSALKALLNAKSENKICVTAVFDNEEVGSTTKQGALSAFLGDTLKRINISSEKTQEEMLIFKANSSMVSADNGHALHPNYSEKSDITNVPVLGKGFLIKYSANQKYTTDALTGAMVRKICDDNKIPYQIYHNNSDVLGGSTLGNLSSTQLGIPCADIGAAMLCMHSPYETTSCEQTQGLIDFMREYFSTNII